MAKPLLRALAGETLPVPPIWMMRQAGRYLPEYRATRERAGDFLTLCYTPDLAAEVTLQPIRRFGFDAAILFADILLVPQALGPDLAFETGEGPRLSTVTTADDLARLSPVEAIHDTLAPVYETVRILARALPPEIALIGFAGAPWTVATYMIAGRGTARPGPGPRAEAERAGVFEALLDRADRGHHRVPLRPGRGRRRGRQALRLLGRARSRAPTSTPTPSRPPAASSAALKARHPGLPVIAFPRGAGPRYEGVRRGDRRRLPSRSTTASTPNGRRAHVQQPAALRPGQPRPRAPRHRRRGAGRGDAPRRRGLRGAAPTSSTSATASRPTPTPTTSPA